MERIGIAASRIAKGNIILYNIFVVLLTLLVSLLVLLICGTTIIIVLIVFDYVHRIIEVPELYRGGIAAWVTCMICLGTVIGLLALWTIGKNIKFRKK